MATTRIIPMHLNKGKTLAQCLADRTEYGMNPDKTEGGALISAFACEPETAVSEFALSKREPIRYGSPLSRERLRRRRPTASATNLPNAS